MKNNLWLPTWTLLKREVLRFVRQRGRVMGAVGTPLLFWALLGTGLNHSFTMGSLSYSRYFFPGTIVMTVLFTAIFSTISIIEDRREGFLQGVLVAPVSRLAIVLGKIFGGAILAGGQALLFLLLAPFLGITLSAAMLVQTALLLFVLAMGLTGLGFFIAWRLDSSQGFHAVMNLFLMPMWFLSGSVFPMTGAPGWLKALMAVNPLSYAVAALHRLFYGEQDGLIALPLSACAAVTVVFAIVTIFMSYKAVGKGGRSI